MIALTVALSVVAVCVAALVAWRWYLEHAKWLQTARNVARDEMASTHESRISELERRAKSWVK